MLDWTWKSLKLFCIQVICKLFYDTKWQWGWKQLKQLHVSFALNKHWEFKAKGFCFPMWHCQVKWNNVVTPVINLPFGDGLYSTDTNGDFEDGL